MQSSFSSIVRSGRYVTYVRSVNILIDAKCLVSTKCLSSTKSLPTTKNFAFAKFLVIDKHLVGENLSNMRAISSSNNFGHWKLVQW